MSFQGRKGPPQARDAPSDAQAKEKLIVYVYEYLTHMGAPETARSFLNEIGWDRESSKAITIGNEAPGFLQQWWNVFWDLYCAAPERRDTCEYSQEAKAFHEYGFVNSGFPQVNGMHGPGPGQYPSSAASPLGMPGPSGPDGFPPGGPQGMGPGGGPPFMGQPIRQPQGQPPNQPSPHSGGAGVPFPGPRYSGPPRPMGPQMMPGPDMRFSGPGVMYEHMRPGSVPPHMLGPGPGPGAHQRLGPSNSMGQRNMGPSPSPIQHFPRAPMPGPPGNRPPMSMNNGWPPSTSAMPFNHDYSDSNGHVLGGMMSNGPGPGTPIMPSPQNMPADANAERFHVLGSHPQTFVPMSDVPVHGEPVMNGDEQMKNSPAGSTHGRNGQGTPVSQGGGQGPASVPPVSQAPGSHESMDHFSGPQFADNSNRYQEQSEIQKIKESMMAESRQFESGKDSGGGSDSGSEFLTGCM